MSDNPGVEIPNTDPMPQPDTAPPEIDLPSEPMPSSEPVRDQAQKVSDVA